MPSGVYFETNLGGRNFYFTSKIVSSIDLTETSTAAIGGLFELVPDATGLATFTARRRDTDAIVAEIVAPVRIGTVTNIWLRPGPSGGW